MNNSLLTAKNSLALGLALATLAGIASQTASAQNAILAEMYGRGVHAYYSGNNNEANQFLTMAINNGIKDPRAYYFRGIVAHAAGRPYEAEADWQRGAELEAGGSANTMIGRSLARFQGSGRIKLEGIRQQARLQALANAAARSRARYGEIEAAGGMAPRASAAGKPSAPAVTAPPLPDSENPFADDNMAEGDASVSNDDALADAMKDPLAGDPGAAPSAAPADATASPFGEAPAADASPFGDAPADDSNPFGDDGADSNPFGDAGMDSNPFE